MSGARASAAALSLLGFLYVHAADAGIVTVRVANKSAAAVADTVIVFDPLDATPPAAAAQVQIDQVDKRFVPRVNVIRTGTAVTFPNSDSIRHQVYSVSTPHPFKLKLYAGAPHVEEVFDRPGLVVLGCNIHDSMTAFVAVVDSPYFSKTSADGTATVTLPPGRYRLRVWHPRLSAAFESRILVVDAAPLILPLSIAVDDSRDAAAAWPE